MKLYYFETINPQKACAVARYLDSPVEFVRVDLAKGEHKTPDYLAINPNGKVPALVDGDTKLWESNAIMCHLARKAKSDLWPTDPIKQIEVLKWLSWNSRAFHPPCRQALFQYHDQAEIQPRRARHEGGRGSHRICKAVRARCWTIILPAARSCSAIT